MRRKIFIVLEKIIPFWFILLFTLIVIGLLDGYIKHAPFQICDWLINYECGFIRRGFLGELIIKFSKISNFNPGFIALLLQILFYFLFFLFSFLFLRRIKLLIPFILLIYSSFIFAFPVNDVGSAGRKEVLYFALLAFVCWSAVKFRNSIFIVLFYLSLILYPFLILSHEMLGLFLPYIVAVFFVRNEISLVDYLRKHYLMLLLLFLNICCFVSALSFSKSVYKVNCILQNLSSLGYPCKGGIFWFLTQDLVYGYNRVLVRIKSSGYLRFYPIILFWVIFCFSFLYPLFKRIFQNRLCIAMIFTSISGSVFLFFFGTDWGRWIHIHAVSLFFILVLQYDTLFYKYSNREFIPSSDKKVLEKMFFIHKILSFEFFFLFIFLLFFISFLFYIPHCCRPNPYLDLSNLNYFRSVNFVKKVLSYLVK